jgi:hypothetical protein
MINGIAKLNSPIMATNLGVICIQERFGPITMSGFHLAISMTAFPENVTAIIAIYQGQLEVTFCYSEPVHSRPRIVALLEETMRSLGNAPSLPTAVSSKEPAVRAAPKVLPVGVAVKG